jgi:hypothetical protein
MPAPELVKTIQGSITMPTDDNKFNTGQQALEEYKQEFGNQ